MATEQQDLEQLQKDYGIYFGGSTLGGIVKRSPLYGNQEFKNLIFHLGTLGEALTLAVSQEYLVPAMQERVPHDMLVIGFDIARQFTIQFAAIGAGAAIGAVIGGLTGTITLPIVGTVAGAGSGAAIGAGIASWMLFGVGLAELAGQAPYIIVAQKEGLERGVELAMNGKREAAAKEFAECFAGILAVILPMILLALLAKGCKGIGGRLMRNPAMVRALAKFAVPPGAFAQAARVLGYTEEELRALASISRGKLIVTRGCNPARLEYVHAGYHAKPVYVKWKSARSGKYVGQVVLSAEEKNALLKDYELKPTSPGSQKLELVPKHDYDKPLQGHHLEQFIEDGEVKYRLLHRDGLPFVGDIDRVVYAEVGAGGQLRPGVYARNHSWTNDDAREIAFMNEEMRKRVPRQQVNYNVFQHGNAWNNLERDASGKLIPGWPKRSPTGTWNFDRDEKLLVAFNGHVYILNWEQFSVFCRAFEQVGLLFPWR